MIPPLPRKRILVASRVALPACLRGASRVARQFGWHLASEMAHTGTYPHHWQGDGVIAVTTQESDFLPELLEADAPCVEIALGGDGVIFPSIRVDQAAIGYLAAEHLYRCGFRNFVRAPFAGDGAERERFAAFEKRIRDWGGRCLPSFPIHPSGGENTAGTWAAYREILLGLLQEQTEPVGIFAANDSVAMEIAGACAQLACSGRAHVGILGVCYDPRLDGALPYPFPSVALDVEGMALRAAIALDDLLHGKTVPDVTMMPPAQIVMREAALGPVGTGRAFLDG